jgi:glycosyltransferase involved in cell wall biosynthesis
MKVGLVIYGSLETLSGGFLYDRVLVAHLRAIGWQVDILSLPWRNYGAHLCDNGRVAWARQIANAGYDLLLQDELNHPSLVLLNRYLRLWLRCPMISIVHHLRSSEEHSPNLMGIYRAVERLYLHSVDGFVYNSHTTRQAVEQKIGTTKPHVIAYPAADHRYPPPRATVKRAIVNRLHANAPLQLLFVGNLIARKGLHTVLDALARLDIDAWQLHVVGSLELDRDYSLAMQHRANTLALSPHITWHGRITDAALEKLFAECDLLVMPAYEGFGIVFLEAMAYGLPVLASRVGAAVEVVQPGVNGDLVPHHDDVALAVKLRQLGENRVQLANLAFHARQHYEQHPTWQESMSKASSWLYHIACALLPQ